VPLDPSPAARFAGGGGGDFLFVELSKTAEGQTTTLGSLEAVPLMLLAFA